MLFPGVLRLVERHSSFASLLAALFPQSELVIVGIKLLSLLGIAALSEYGLPVRRKFVGIPFLAPLLAKFALAFFVGSTPLRASLPI